jgi:hypothetical protein
MDYYNFRLVMIVVSESANSKVNDCFISWKCLIVIYLQIHRHTNTRSQFWSVCLWFSRKTNVKHNLIGYDWLISVQEVLSTCDITLSLKIDPGRWPESDITLARHKHRWGKPGLLLSFHRHTNTRSQFWSVCLWFSRKTNVKHNLIGY